MNLYTVGSHGNLFLLQVSCYTRAADVKGLLRTVVRALRAQGADSGSLGMGLCSPILLYTSSLTPCGVGPVQPQMSGLGQVGCLKQTSCWVASTGGFAAPLNRWLQRR